MNIKPLELTVAELGDLVADGIFVGDATIGMAGVDHVLAQLLER